MSLKFKALLKRKGITQTFLAKSLNVSSRTVRNWAKEDGTVPTLTVADEITKLLNISTYDLYSCFVEDPDNEDDENKFEWHDHDFSARMSEECNYAPGLFHRLKSVDAGREGVLRYQNEMIRFSDMIFCDNYQEKNLVKRFGIAPFSGIVLIDDSLNMIPLQISNIVSWRVESNQFDNFTVRVTVSYPFMTEMAQDSASTDSYDIYITFWKSSDSKNPFTLSSYRIENKNQEDVIPAYIKEFRERRQLTQNNFAAGLLDEIKGKNVSKWENGDLVPSFKQIQRICIMYGISPEALFDAYDNSYFSKHSADIGRNCFDIGINYLFNRTNSDEEIQRLVEVFKFMHDAVWKPEETEQYSFAFYIAKSDDDSEEKKGFITDVAFKDEEVVIKCNDGECITVNKNELSIDARYNIQNYTYRFEGTYKGNIKYALEFSVFI